MLIESLITKEPNFIQEACHDLVLSKEVDGSAPLHIWFNKAHHFSTTGYLKAGHMLRPDIAILHEAICFRNDRDLFCWKSWPS